MSLPSFIEQGRGGTAVLLLHGIGGGKSIWGEQGSGALAALAAAGYRTLALDFPGYGESLALGEPSLDSMVDAVLSLIDHAQAQRTVLVGHSMGGMVAQELLKRAPQAVQGLVLTCT